MYPHEPPLSLSPDYVRIKGKLTFRLISIYYFTCYNIDCEKIYFSFLLMVLSFTCQAQTKQ